MVEIYYCPSYSFSPFLPVHKAFHFYQGTWLFRKSTAFLIFPGSQVLDSGWERNVLPPFRHVCLPPSCCRGCVCNGWNARAHDREPHVEDSGATAQIGSGILITTVLGAAPQSCPLDSFTLEINKPILNKPLLLGVFTTPRENKS